MRFVFLATVLLLVSGVARAADAPGTEEALQAQNLQRRMIDGLRSRIGQLEIDNVQLRAQLDLMQERASEGKAKTDAPPPVPDPEPKKK